MDAYKRKGLHRVDFNLKCFMQADTRAVRCTDGNVHVRAEPHAFHIPVTITALDVDSAGKAVLVVVETSPGQDIRLPMDCCTFEDGSQETPIELIEFRREWMA